MLFRSPGRTRVVGLADALFSKLQQRVLGVLFGNPGRSYYLTEIISRAQAREIKVILTGMEAPPNFGPAYTSEFREVYRQLAKEHDVVFVPFYLEGVAGISNLNIADGIHPNAEGSRIVEKTVWTALEPLLAKRTADRKNPGR